MAAAEGGLEEMLGCDGRGFSGGLPLLPEFTSLSGSGTAGSSEALSQIGDKGLRVLPEKFFSLQTQQPSALRRPSLWGKLEPHGTFALRKGLLSVKDS